MTSRLPDIAREERAAIPLPLDWVGMRNIATLLRLDADMLLPAMTAVAVDLPDPRARGIHMSRLYRLLDECAADMMSPRTLTKLLERLVASHTDCGARAARLALEFSLPRRRPALVTAGLAGWKHYPIRLLAELDQLDGSGARLQLEARVAYSSTCPCSAALSRQALRDAFAADFAADHAIARDAALDWISERASLATPHSQRSEATLAIALAPHGASLPIHALLDTAEEALGTPVQTAVKRADEQAFALRNGANLMYVEDAARRLRLALEAGFGACAVRVSHVESLHAHDAVAEASTPGWRALAGSA